MSKIPHSLSLVVPVYNEANLVKPSVARIMAVLAEQFEDFELILIDDGSVDETGKIMDELAAQDEHIKVLHNLINLNLGVSVQRGMALASKEFVLFNSIDLPLAPEDFAALVTATRACDVLVLERIVYAGATAWRQLTSKGNRGLLKLLFPVLSTGIYDMNFTQVYKRDCLRQIMPMGKSPAFTTMELVLRARHLQFSVNTIATEYHARESGKASLGKPHDILWTLYDMLRFRVLLWRGLIR